MTTTALLFVFGAAVIALSPLLIPEKIGVVELHAEWTNQAGHLMCSHNAAATAQPVA